MKAISKVVANFGRNLFIRPNEYFEPSSENELLEILKKCRGKTIRAIGSLHSWSDAPNTDDVLLSTRKLDSFKLIQESTGTFVEVGGGTQIKHLLDKLRAHGQTLPAIGLITEQTIAGATSTGTHGSGRHSLSHYLESIRIVHWSRKEGGTGDSSETSEPAISEIDQGDVLKAARCAIGTFGVIASVRIRCRDIYQIEEHWSKHSQLLPVIELEKDYPLQQFYLIPWSWNYIAQNRREILQRPSWLARLYRLYCFSILDVALHGVILGLVRIFRSTGLTHWTFRNLLPRFVPFGLRIVDEASKMLVMEHELFRHIETEIFVQRPHLEAALDYVKQTLQYAGGESQRVQEEFFRQVEELNLTLELLSIKNQYVHHYPICVRRVLSDDTLISMGAPGNDGKKTDWYAISLISYAHPSQRDRFRSTMRFLAKSLLRRWDGRVHWGKYAPLTAEELTDSYPRFSDFEEIRNTMDPEGVFQNTWTRSLSRSVRDPSQEPAVDVPRSPSQQS